MVDDYIPCYNAERGPAFSKGKDQELWVLLLEKAYAKLYGSYHNIVSGQTTVAFRDLTGAPGEYYNFKKDTNPKEVYPKILSWHKSGYLLAAATPKANGNSDRDANPQGIVNNHAYSMLSVFQHEGKNFVKLRNPWGKTEWNGNWAKSNKDQWTDGLRKAAEMSKEDLENENGIFIMEYKDFANEYENVQCCKFQKGYYHNSIKVNHEKG